MKEKRFGTIISALRVHTPAIWLASLLADEVGEWTQDTRKEREAFVAWCERKPEEAIAYIWPYGLWRRGTKRRKP